MVGERSNCVDGNGRKGCILNLNLGALVYFKCLLEIIKVYYKQSII